MGQKFTICNVAPKCLHCIIFSATHTLNAQLECYFTRARVTKCIVMLQLAKISSHVYGQTECIMKWKPSFGNYPGSGSSIIRYTLQIRENRLQNWLVSIDVYLMSPLCHPFGFVLFISWTIRGDKVSILTHTYPHKPPRKIKWPSAPGWQRTLSVAWCLIWRFTNIEKSIVMRIHDPKCSYWDQVSLKEHKT